MPDTYEHPQDSWLSGMVRETLRRPAGDLVADVTLTSLGITSIQAITLQNQIGEHTGLVVPLETLLDEYTIADLAAVLEEMQSWTFGDVGAVDANLSQIADYGQ